MHPYSEVVFDWLGVGMCRGVLEEKMEKCEGLITDKDWQRYLLVSGIIIGPIWMYYDLNLDIQPTITC